MLISPSDNVHERRFNRQRFYYVSYKRKSKTANKSNMAEADCIIIYITSFFKYSVVCQSMPTYTFLITRVYGSEYIDNFIALAAA